MKRYLFLQGKRNLRYLPGAICAAVVLVGVLLFAFSLLMGQNNQNNMKLQAAIVGDTQEPIMQMGVAALGSFDSTQYTLEVLVLDEETAKKELEAGNLTAYVVIPEGFMDNALKGQVAPLEFVSNGDAVDLGTVFKHEVTAVVANLVLESQRGVYGMAAAFRANTGDPVGDRAPRAGLSYVSLVLARDAVYMVQELGIADGMDLAGTLLCGFAVLLLLLLCLPFAPLLVCRDMALGQMLASRGKPAWKQALLAFLAYGLTLLLLCAILLMAVWLASCLGLGQWLTFGGAWLLLCRLLPVILLAASFSYLCYSLATELISGVLLQFFATAALCFVSGCMYPADFFPLELQKMAAWLPTGVARSCLAYATTGRVDILRLAVLLCYCAAFVGVAVWSRTRRVSRKGGGV